MLALVDFGRGLAEGFAAGCGPDLRELGKFVRLDRQAQEGQTVAGLVSRDPFLASGHCLDQGDAPFGLPLDEVLAPSLRPFLDRASFDLARSDLAPALADDEIA